MFLLYYYTYADLIAGNILGGKNIFGVDGTMTNRGAWTGTDGTQQGGSRTRTATIDCTNITEEKYIVINGHNAPEANIRLT